MAWYGFISCARIIKLKKTLLVNKMLLEKIENNLKIIEKKIQKESFIYDFLEAYDQPKSTILRLKKGDYNLSQKSHELIWKKKIHFYQTQKNEDIHDIIDELSKSNLTEKNKIRFIIVTDFKDFLSVDIKKNQNLDIKINELSKNADFFLPLVGIEKVDYLNEAQADVKAAEKLGKLYDIILKDNDDFKEKDKDTHGLNIFFNRILFCFFSEDSKIFDSGLFTKSIVSHTNEDGSDLDAYLTKLFQVLNDDNRKDISEYLKKFPYVNGGLFKNNYRIPVFTKESRKILIQCGSLDWKSINPDILGSMLQAVISSSQREELGIHYTSVKNILKVIKPLFLDELYDDLNKCNDDTKKLKNLLRKIYNMKFFDPACGSGNFLIICFKEICRIEIEIYKKLKEIDKNSWLILKSGIKLTQFYGIEIDDYAHETAKLSLWMAEHQMNLAFDEIIGDAKPTLPLSPSANIVNKNSLKLDWKKFVSQNSDGIIYIIGNPPYIGSSKQTTNNKSDMSLVLGNLKSYKNLDYISCWFYLAARFISNTGNKFSFVSTSSICQGDQVSMLWPYIINNDLEIFFAYKPFKWTNLAKGNAGVTCIILGLQKKSSKKKQLFDDKSNSKFETKTISPYLLEINPSLFVGRTTQQISGLPAMVKGNQATDGGHFILNENEYKKIISESPNIKKFIKKYIGAKELLGGIKRWCLWIEDKDIDEALKFNFIKNRINKVKNFRLNRNSSFTNSTNKPPHKFMQIQSNPAKAIVIPSVTSNRRKYLTVDFIQQDTVISNLGFAIYNPDLYIFGILSSSMHRIWLETVAGRFGEGFRYSSVLCYNTFYFPKINLEQKKNIEESVKNIINEREKFSESTLSDLYDPLKMPQSLLNCHNRLDQAIEICYKDKSFINDNEKLKFLFNEFDNAKKINNLI